MAKHKYLSNFDYFSLQSDTLLAHWIVIAPQRHKGFKSSNKRGAFNWVQWLLQNNQMKVPKVI